MKLSYNLTLEQSQKLIMTPELRQAIQLLQYNSLELNDYLSRELEENPMLEMEKPVLDVESVDIDNKDGDIDWKEYIEKYDDISYKSEIDKNTKEYNLESFISYTPTLKEHLLSQLTMITIDDKDKKVAEYIINNIDDNGYLIASIEEIAAMMKVSAEKAEEALAIVQHFEPLGVGARDLKECLLIQVREMNNPMLENIIANYLEDIAGHRIIKIAKENDLDISFAQNLCDIVKSLEPKPGRTFKSSSDDVRYIIPDATIELVDGEYIIMVNDFTGPRLNINNFYRNMLKDGGDLKATEFLQEKFNSAMWIIKSIEQRRQTIYNVVEAILRFQSEFFKSGEKSLVPLTLKDVAEHIGVHESTVSRATNGKYVQTPRGLYELKFFFSTGLNCFEGDISSTSVKSMIKDIVEGENSKKPLSDQKIAEILGQKGTSISRRTVAKYRDELNIPSSSMRKRY